MKNNKQKEIEDIIWGNKIKKKLGKIEKIKVFGKNLKENLTKFGNGFNEVCGKIVGEPEKKSKKKKEKEFDVYEALFGEKESNIFLL